jgi:hypothetical protein
LDAILAGLQGGQQLELVFWLTTEEQKSVGIPLTGFSTNWTALQDKL